MAFLRKTLAPRLFNTTKMYSPPPSPFKPNPPAKTTFTRDFLSESGEKGFIRRFLHKRALGQPEFGSLFFGEKLREKLKSMNIGKDRLRFEGLTSPLDKEPEPGENGISVQDAKKLIRLSQLDMLKTKLKQIPKTCISYEELVETCVENTNRDQGLEFAKMLDDSGAVIVLGNVVFLQPEQVTKAIQNIMPISSPNDPRRKELEELEKQKVAIDEQAEKRVRRELWVGLGLLMAQTAGFMRLTFCDLSWDVMEPICFFVASSYVMGGYAFFLRTTKEPTFEGYYKRRFSTKQKRLMKAKEFDVERFNDLKTALYPSGFRLGTTGRTKDKSFS